MTIKRQKPSASTKLLDLEIALNQLQELQCAPESARVLIRHFSRRLTRICNDNAAPLGADEYKLLFEYLVPAFVRILNGSSADVALGLRPGKGRPPFHRDRDLIIAALVKSQVMEGVRVRTATENVANKYFPQDTGYSAVRDAYAAHRQELAKLSNTEILALSEISDAELAALISTPIK